MRKRIAVWLCCALFCLSAVAAAESTAPVAPSATAQAGGGSGVACGAVPDAQALTGFWLCCGANDQYPYLVIHSDGTLEAYNWWQMGLKGDLGLGLMCLKGAYAFDPDGGRVTLPNGEVYAVSRTETPEDLETSDGEDVEGAPYVLHWEGAVDGEPYEMNYVPVSAIPCFPDVTELTYGDRSWSNEDLGMSVRFSADGACILTNAGVETSGTFTLDGGRLLFTAGDQVTTLYLQFRDIPYEGLSDAQLDQVDALEAYSDQPNQMLYTDGFSAFLDRGHLMIYGLLSDGKAVRFLRSDHLDTAVSPE